MAWNSGLLTINGQPAHSSVDARFASDPPARQLPRLAWFGVYNILPPGRGFWDPVEGPQLDAVEEDLLRLCDAHGRGWAAYVQRLDSPGIREYYIYFGPGAELQKVLPALRTAHPHYRLEYDQMDDPTWSQYRMWLQRLAAAAERHA